MGQWRPTIALRSLSPHLGPSINNRKGAIWFALIISLVGIVYLIIGLLLAFALNLMTLGFVRLNGHNILILPARLIPFLGNAYSRACEFTCDRIATYVTASPAAAERGLTMLAVGRDLYADIDVDEYLHDSEQNRGFILRMTEKMSTHPPLPKRIAEVRRIAASWWPQSPAPNI
ncbi:M48 family metalloprotease [Kyrpidia sp.]|uniref:M48 family metalloprotease n=1 Tax=Kyrpidia sp. TaxID=2073077 RepID=UPI002583F9D4|nr:M48 family metalloprotease [Kyrpidia sp.]MCL6576182.1 M48 family metalloprotease [Kyrpidia sp.]